MWLSLHKARSVDDASPKRRTSATWRRADLRAVRDEVPADIHLAEALPSALYQESKK
jgi:hypothetical protein